MVTGAHDQTLTYFDELLSEKEICRKYKKLLSAAELHRARDGELIEFFTGKQGAILYHPDAVAAYLQNKRTECRARPSFGNTAATGLAVSPIPNPITPAGTTSEQDELIAERLAQKFSPKLKIV